MPGDTPPRSSVRGSEASDPSAGQSSLASLLARYEEGVTALRGSNSASASLLAVLVSRDRLSAALAREASPQDVRRVVDLDQQLQEKAPALPERDWRAWRQTLNPSTRRWWWHLDEIGARKEEEHDLAWILAALVLTAAALGLAVEVIRRIWGAGPDALSVVGSVLSLAVAGSPLTKYGRDIARRLMRRLGLSTRYLGELMLGAAALALVITLPLYFALPALARVLNNRGYTLLQSGDLNGAQRAFARSTSIEPGYAVAYYNLADAHVAIGNYALAEELYQKALAADRTFEWGYNGLGYALVLEGEPERSIPVFYAGLQLATEDVVRTALWVNLGRAYSEMGSFREAEIALQQALSLDPRDAAAHCILAQVTGALAGPQDEITLHWENCLRYADESTPRGKELATMAQAHLQAREERQ
ncbi:MAG: tetratricopeptide repeat protein [Anaerolineae bacterium]